MALYYQEVSREWKEMYSGVFVSNFHRYQSGGGAAVFKLEPNAIIPEHNHPTGEHGYIIKGSGWFDDKYLSEGDAFWVDYNETHKVTTEQGLVFYATSLPRKVSGDVYL